ncbi:uncharacterized protein LAESUDRAFT_366322 [Laetiporus sulphureus 93-53]|uniref:Uncharacterized protein n=1 Tax=Laetiporus sulphureus 93-53 TaxID=1314785 RepID=A0A165CSL9_9APHY|nr:uncharacterized protein LAESUDRAFT_366322 [Laetiporus sulphureus 93-53]KZT03365.1 hypothetical protein LAESUDRAFT_366322 [Laetiporus sulphureus 93-53]
MPVCRRNNKNKPRQAIRLGCTVIRLTILEVAILRLGLARIRCTMLRTHATSARNSTAESVAAAFRPCLVVRSAILQDRMTDGTCRSADGGCICRHAKWRA